MPKRNQLTHPNLRQMLDGIEVIRRLLLKLRLVSRDPLRQRLALLFGLLRLLPLLNLLCRGLLTLLHRLQLVPQMLCRVFFKRWHLRLLRLRQSRQALFDDSVPLFLLGL